MLAALLLVALIQCLTVLFKSHPVMMLETLHSSIFDCCNPFSHMDKDLLDSDNLLSF